MINDPDLDMNHTKYGKHYKEKLKKKKIILLIKFYVFILLYYY